MKKILSALALLLAASAFTAIAQDAPVPSEPGKPKHGAPPIVAALDTNKDGVIDAQEIANAPAALQSLDKNGDGKLTRDELHPGRKDGKKKGKKGAGAPE